MEKYIKRYFWTINLVTILLCSYLAAKSSNQFVGAYLLSKADVSLVQPRRTVDPTNAKNKKTETSRKARKDPFQNVLLDPITEGEGQKSLVDVPEANLGSASEYHAGMDCPQTSIPSTIAGTVVSSNPDDSAVMLEGADKKIKLYEVGHTVQSGVVIKAVFRNKVFLNNSGRTECIYRNEKDAKKQKKPEPGATEGIKNVGGNSFIISKEEKDRALGDMAKLATQARIVPSFKNGQSNGFRIYSIKPGSLYQKIGIKNGDIIQSINGMDITSPEKALEIYSKLKTEDRLSMDLLRRGSKLSLDYSFQ